MILQTYLHNRPAIPANLPRFTLAAYRRYCRLTRGVPTVKATRTAGLPRRRYQFPQLHHRKIVVQLIDTDRNRDLSTHDVQNQSWEGRRDLEAFESHSADIPSQFDRSTGRTDDTPIAVHFEADQPAETGRPLPRWWERNETDLIAMLDNRPSETVIITTRPGITITTRVMTQDDRRMFKLLEHWQAGRSWKRAETLMHLTQRERRALVARLKSLLGADFFKRPARRDGSHRFVKVKRT